jgi:hypothetical protein
MTEGKMNGALTIENGTVTIYKYKPAVPMNGNYAVTVKSSGRLVGQAIVHGLNAQSGAEIVPCASAVNEMSPGTITCNNTITVSDGATVNFLVNKTKNSQLSAKNLTFNGTVKLTFTAERQLEVGDELTLWTVSGTFSGTPKFELPAMFTWDTSRINEGILKITGVDTGVKTTLVDSDPMNVYDLSGRLVKRMATVSDTQGLPAGIYIRGGKKVVVK